MSDPHLVTFTVKELLERLDTRMGQLDQKLDLRLTVFDERLSHVERTLAERQYIFSEHDQLKKEVEEVKEFRSRFLPVSLLVFLLLAVGFVWDFYFRVLAG